MRQQGLTVVAPVKSGSVKALRCVLKKMQDELTKERQKQREAYTGKEDCRKYAFDSVENSYVRFGETKTHFARFVVLDGEPVEDECWDDEPTYPPLLVFASNHDDGHDAYLESLIRAGKEEDGRPGLNAIFSHCEGYPPKGTADPEAFKTFINKHREKRQTYYVCYPGITKKSALNALEIFCKISDFLDRDRTRLEKLKPGAIVKEINAFVDKEKLDVMTETLPKEVRIRSLFIRLGVLVVAVFAVLFTVLFLLFQDISLWASLLRGFISAVVFVVVLTVIFALFVRRREKREKKDYERTHTRNYVPSRRVLEQEALEETIAQNQMTLVTPVKPTFVRRLALRLVLVVVNYLARKGLTQGALGEVRTVHFARWFPINKGKRLVFLSNFDESWQQYIGAFVDLLSIYLTAIWGNTKCFPPTKFLVGEGARDIEGFMQFIRETQIPSEVFYSAYSEVAAQNIINAVRVREQLGREMNEEEAQEWLHRFGGAFGLAEQEYHDCGKRLSLGQRILKTLGVLNRNCPETFPDEPKVKEYLDDIQAWVVTGYGAATHVGYLFLKIKKDGAGKARAWLAEVVEKTTRADQHDRQGGRVVWPSTPLNIAFTAGGLKALGLTKKSLDTFPSHFTQGIAEEYFDQPLDDECDDPRPAPEVPSRSRKLGDIGDSAPEHWDVGGSNKSFDVLLLLHATGEDGLQQHMQRERERIEKYGDGVEEMGYQVAHRLTKMVPNPGGKKDPKRIFLEHFGFRDGIAKPAIRDSGFNKDSQITIAAGEFVLGYRDQYDYLPLTPSVPDELDTDGLLFRARHRRTAEELSEGKDLGRNGTYVVFRKLSQDVYGFWKYFDDNSKDREEMIRLASRAVGRWPNGTPLTLSPEREEDCFAREQFANNFLYVKKPKLPDDLGKDDPCAKPLEEVYAALKDGDLHGYRCPYASHIRRSNPRDSLSTTNSLTIADRHHIIRRGTPYGEILKLPPWDDVDLPPDDKQERGLMFLALNTSFRRQFEFVQVAWNNGPRFNGLYNARDPLIGPQPPPPPDPLGDLTLEAQPYRDRVRKVPRFTTVKGGAYLFLPSIRALKFLARLTV